MKVNENCTSRIARRHVRGSSVFLAVLMVVALSGCGDKPKPEAPVVRPIKILTVGGVGPGGTLEYPGRVLAAQETDLGFEVNGRIVELPVKSGQPVKKGDVIARLDARDFKAAMDAEVARLNAARADYRRYRELYTADAASKQELDVARKNFEVAEANVRVARKTMDDATLRAPFNGVVAQKLVDDPPINVQAKQPVVRLQDPTSFRIVVNVPESDMAMTRPSRLEEGKRKALAQVVVSSFPDRQFPARVTEIATAADPTTRTFEVRLAFERPTDVNVQPGMTAKVVIKVPADSKIDLASMRIPSAAVLADAQGKPFVWIVDPATMKVASRTIEVGPMRADEISVKSGLQPGDLVAVSGVHQLREGMVVSRLDSR